MDFASSGLALSALVVALIALQRASRSRTAPSHEDSIADQRRRLENAKEELAQELAVQRKLIAKLAGGAKLTPEMIEEGRLWHDIPAAAAIAMLERGSVHIIDVRTSQETRLGIIPGAKLIPVDELEARLREVPKDARPKLIYCAAGGRSAAACEFLARQGFDELYNLEGGFSSWTGPRAQS